MLFQVKQKYNEEDLWALHDLETKKQRVHQGVVIYLQICALMGILVLVGVLVGIVVWMITCLEGPWMIGMVLVLVWALFIPNVIIILAQVAFQSAKEIDEKSLEKCKERIYTFFDDHFDIEDEDNTSSSQYSVVTKFVEKGDHFFIFIDTNVAYVIRKSCFILGRPEDFGPFMRGKYRTKDMDTPEKGLDET